MSVCLLALTSPFGPFGSLLKDIYLSREEERNKKRQIKFSFSSCHIHATGAVAVAMAACTNGGRTRLEHA